MICHPRFWSWFNKPTAIFCLLKASHYWACWVNTSKHSRKVFSLEEGVKKDSPTRSRYWWRRKSWSKADRVQGLLRLDRKDGCSGPFCWWTISEASWRPISEANLRGEFSICQEKSPSLNPNLHLRHLLPKKRRLQGSGSCSGVDTIVIATKMYFWT